MRRSIILAGVAIATLAVATSGVRAQQPLQRVQVGVLECRGGASIGFVVGSVTNLGCVLRIEGLPEDRYIATVRRFGVDLGFTEQTQFSWAVNAPAGRVGRGELAGNYSGVGANASVGVGFGSNFLVGGPQNAYALQPISVQGQTGLNVAAGVAEIELQPVRLAPRGFRRHFSRHRHRR